jgi:hypothetical protein
MLRRAPSRVVQRVLPVKKDIQVKTLPAELQERETRQEPGAAKIREFNVTQNDLSRYWNVLGLEVAFPHLQPRHWPNANGRINALIGFETTKYSDSGIHHDGEDGVIFMMGPSDGYKYFHTFAHIGDIKSNLSEASTVSHVEFQEDDCNAIGLIKETFHLVAGSALFVPGGVVHRVETTGKVCGLRFNVEARR